MTEYTVETAAGLRETVTADSPEEACRAFALRYYGTTILYPQSENPGWFAAFTHAGRVGHGLHAFPVRFKVAIYVPGEDAPSYNGLRFESREEAEAYGHDLLSRWFVPTRFEVEAA